MDRRTDRGYPVEEEPPDLETLRAELQQSLADAFRHLGHEERAEHIGEVEFAVLLEDFVDDSMNDG
jgi:hypothetical protein